MRELLLGEAIKQRRIELGLTQEEVCEGICEEKPRTTRIKLMQVT